MTDYEIIGTGLAAIVGILVGADAKKYDMPPILWGGFTFLIMIIGLPLYFIVRHQKKKNMNNDF